MRPARTTFAVGGKLSAGAIDGRALVTLTPQFEVSPTELELAEGELLMVIETLAMVYAELCGARPESLARGVNRTLRNRTAAARQRRIAAAGGRPA